MSGNGYEDGLYIFGSNIWFFGNKCLSFGIL